MRKLRWGILGVAKINNRLIPSFHRLTCGELRAIASRDLAKAQQAAQAGGIPVAHAGYEALLADPSIDAVYIPLPNTMHDEWARKAADAGKHILCEKPLTPNAAEAESLIAYCGSKGVKLMDGFMWPHHPRTDLIRQAIDRGQIGKVKRVSGAFTFHLPLDPSNIRLQVGTAGGSLLDVGCYPVYGIRWAFGVEPVRAFATARMGYGVDLEMSGILWFADGRIASFDCGFTAPMRQWLEIVGETGVIRVPDMWAPGVEAGYLIERANGQPPERYSIHGEDQIRHMLDNFSAAVLDGKPVKADPKQAYGTLRVLDALTRSAREGRTVDI